MSRQRIERERLQPVSKIWVAKNRKRLFKREHGLYHRAKLTSLRRIAAGEMLIAGEHAIRKTVIGVERRQLLLYCAPVILLARHNRPDRRGFDCLPIVDSVGGEADLAEFLASSSRMVSRVIRCVYWK